MGKHFFYLLILLLFPLLLVANIQRMPGKSVVVKAGQVVSDHFSIPALPGLSDAYRDIVSESELPVFLSRTHWVKKRAGTDDGCACFSRLQCGTGLLFDRHFHEIEAIRYVQGFYIYMLRKLIL